MLKIIFIATNAAIILCQSIAFGQKKTRQPTDHYEIHSTVVIGEASTKNWNGYLIKPKIVTCNHNGEIAIADEALSKIKVFDKKGHFIYDFGDKGQGPTEFQHISAMTANLRNEWIVIDFINAKFVVFDSRGNYVLSAEFPVKKVQWPRRIYATPDSGYILLAKNYSQDEFLFHHFSSNFKHLKSFGRIPIISSKNKNFEEKIAEIHPGEIAIGKNGTFFYVPGLYSSKIYVYDYTSGQQINILRGSQSKTVPYQLKSLNESLADSLFEEYHFSLAGRNYRYVGRRSVLQGGMIFMNPDVIGLLLVSTPNNSQVEIGVELFATDGSFSAYQWLSNNLPYMIWTACGNKWYLIDYQKDLPYVTQYQIEKIQ